MAEVAAFDADERAAFEQLLEDPRGTASFARRLQSGRLGVYVAYLAGLIIALLLGARLGVVG